MWATDTTLIRAQALFQRLPTDPAHPIPAPRVLPTPNNMRFHRNEDFIGREVELCAIAVAMKERHRAVVAVGIGGVGKTQLVVEWVHCYGQFFGGGVFWLNFATAADVELEAVNGRNAL